MEQRKKTFVIFSLVYVILALWLYFGLKENLKNNFSIENLNKTISGKSIYRDSTTDLCKYQILGDPKEVGNYVKIEIFCGGDHKVVSTLSLSAIEDKTIFGFLQEYSRIIGFDEKLFKEQNFTCYVDGKLLTDVMLYEIIRPTATISCNSVDTKNEK